MKKNSVYRTDGRALTKGKILNIFLIGLVFSTLIGIVTGIGGSYNPVFEEETLNVINPGNPALAQLFNLIAVALGGYVTYSFTKMFIGVSKNEKPEFEPILTAGIKEQPVNAPLLSVISGFFLGLWTLLFVIPGIVKSYSYAMSSYLLVNEKTLGPVDAITKSRQLMNGKKMQLFMLDLGYLGWYLLSLFTFGILAIWVSAWHQTARTLFFKDAYNVK
ncbi:MAG: DUF975 family protein [Firmicutes bacterium]|nr:DUF975 family protein [Bacillota bacterium]